MQDPIKKRQSPSLSQKEKSNPKVKRESDRNEDLKPIWKLKHNEDYAKVFAGRCLNDSPRMNNNIICCSPLHQTNVSDCNLS